MKNKILSVAILSAVAGGATAVNLNPDGLGSVLLYPYYTANNDMTTAIQVVNTTDNFKAVKVRINEGVNTWEVLDFNLYLSPWDVWTAGITRNDSGAPVIITTDNTCTVPAIPAGGQELRTDLMDAYSDAHKDPVGSDRAAANNKLTPTERLAEGHIEMIEMGEVQDVNARKFIKHDAQGVADCQSLLDVSWGGNPWTRGDDSSNQGMSAPTGGLFGNADIIDVAKASIYSFEATAIEDFYTSPAHADPGSAFPNLAGQFAASGGINDSLASRTSHVINASNTATPTVVTTIWETAAEAFSAVLMADEIYNTYSVEAGLEAATDWVVTFPTKHYFVNASTYTAGSVYSGQAGALPQGVTGQTSGVAPFSNGFGVGIDGLRIWDREERGRNAQLDFSPSLTPPDEMNKEVNVLEFSQERNVFNSILGKYVGEDFENGWARLSFRTNKMVAPVGLNGGFTHTYNGFPVVGFGVTKIHNKTLANGTLEARYGLAHEHKYNRNITVSQ